MGWKVSAIHKQCPIEWSISKPCPLVDQILSKVRKHLPYPWTSENIVDFKIQNF